MRTKSPFADAIKALEARVDRIATNMAEQSDMRIVTRRLNALESICEGFLRHAHVDTPTGDNAVKASVEAEESARHDG